MSNRLDEMVTALEHEARSFSDHLAQARARIAALEKHAAELETRNRELAARLPDADRAMTDAFGVEEPLPAAATGNASHEAARRVAPEQQAPAPSPQALLKQWYRRYPNTFFKRHTRPLAIGIHDTLASREPFDEKLIRRALAGYVNLPRYLKSVRSGASRVGLNGEDAGQVSDDDARHAREQLDRLQARQQERETRDQQRRMAHKMSQLAKRSE